MRYYSTQEKENAPISMDGAQKCKNIVGKEPVTNSRAKKKAQTRSRILRAANVLFRRQSYEDAKTTELASKVGVSHGTIFAHFDSKASILRELVMRQMRQDLEALKDIKVNGTGAVEKLKDLARTLWARAHSAPELTAAYHSQSWTWTPAEEKEYRELIEGGLLLAKNIVLQGIEREEISANVNVDLLMEIFQAQYFDCIRQAQYGRLDVEAEVSEDMGEEGGEERKDPYLAHFESVIDYLLG